MPHLPSTVEYRMPSFFRFKGSVLSLVRMGKAGAERTGVPAAALLLSPISPYNQLEILIHSELTL